LCKLVVDDNMGKIVTASSTNSAASREVFALYHI
jgi:hypothetical protein